MAGFKVITAGYTGLTSVGPGAVPTTTQEFPLGTMIEAVCPYRGALTLVYMKVAAASSVGAVKKMTAGWVATATADEAGIGRPICVTLNKTTASNQYAWCVIRGVTPVRGAASIAIGQQTCAGVDQLTGANTATKCYQNICVDIASASTDGTIALAYTKTEASSTIIEFLVGTPYDYGLFVGQKLTGTGMGTNAQVASLSKRYAVVDVVCSAIVSTVITKTLVSTTDSLYWNICNLNHPTSSGVV